MPVEVDSETAELISEVQNAIRIKKDSAAPGDVVHKGDGEVPAPMFHVQKQGPGYTYIYDTQTGERSVTDINMLPIQLKKRRPDGSKVFTTNPKGLPTPIRGTIKCLLHPKGPNRAEYDQMGLPSCPCSNIPNEYQLQLHMKHKHKTAWETLENIRITAEKKAEKDMQVAILTAATKGLTQPVATVTQTAPIEAPEVYVSEPKRRSTKRHRRTKTA